MSFSVGDIIAILSTICLALANYFGMRSEIRINKAQIEAKIDNMRQEITPVLRWWNRIAENQASRMFIRSRSTDEKES